LIDAQWACESRENLATIRNTQLDGLRTFAVLGVMWHHWSPKSWRGYFPFEIGLFFFLTLTGFLITRILLREKTAGEEVGGSWKRTKYREFMKRRMTRILIPCYAAMVFAILVGASDIRHHALVYFAHVSNFHMAFMREWPSGTAHYWTLGLQMQFYLIWPLLVFLTPTRHLATVFIVCAAFAPLSRIVIFYQFPQIYHGDAITTSALDYFAVGAMLALAMQRGMLAGDVRLKWVSLAAFAVYLVLYSLNEMGRPVAGLGYVQQTILSVAFIGLISSTMAGFQGWLGKLLDHPAIQHIGKISYGLYLFHTPVPLFLGWVIPQLWNPFFSGPWLLVRLFAFSLASWGLAYLCWKYLEHAGPRKAPGQSP
jgi:peptidoglycan/LPS O-acetylase OafA/YrhL